MALPTTINRVFILVILLVSLAGWVISLAGVAKLTDLCNAGKTPTPDGMFYDSNNNVMGDLAYACGLTYSLHWWIIALQFFAIVFAVLGSFIEFFHNKHFVLHIFAIATTLYCVFAEQYVMTSYAMKDSKSDEAKANKAAAAGAIAVLTSNFLFALIFAKDEQAPATAEPVSKA